MLEGLADADDRGEIRSASRSPAAIAGTGPGAGRAFARREGLSRVRLLSGHHDITAGDTLLLVGRWTDPEALERHYESACFREITGRFADLVVEAWPSVSLYEVVEIDRL